MHQVTIQNKTHLLERTITARVCDTFFCRLRGLMFTSPITMGMGLLLVEDRNSRLDSAIHMLFVNYDLAIIWINEQKQVVDKCIAHRWHPFYMPSAPARYILELNPDHFHDFIIRDMIDLQDE